MVVSNSSRILAGRRAYQVEELLVVTRHVEFDRYTRSIARLTLTQHVA